jgi:HK97 gp10 family phage protein
MTPEELAKRFDKAGDEFTDIKVRLLRRMTVTAEAESKKVTPVETGTLRRSITHRVEPTGSHGVIGTNVQYARYVHEGTVYNISRPFLERGIRNSQPQFDQYIEEAGDELMARIAQGG